MGDFDFRGMLVGAAGARPPRGLAASCGERWLPGPPFSKVYRMDSFR